MLEDAVVRMLAMKGVFIETTGAGDVICLVEIVRQDATTSAALRHLPDIALLRL